MSPSQTPRTATLASDALRPEPLRLWVLEGPDRGRDVVLEAGTAVVGSLPEIDLPLTDPTVSRRHASVEVLAGRVRLKDLGSKNGTRYLGARVEAAEIPVGRSFQVGSTTIAVLPQRLPPERLAQAPQLQGLVGASVPMRKLFAELEQVAPTDATVLLHGETGTGKDALARALHALSPRRDGPFEVVDCAGLTAELAQSHLFGHLKGAFTGAVRDADGALERADGGTLFLDSVAELPLAVQPLLLRALESRTFQSIGDDRVRSSDFRIVASTHRDLRAEVRAGAFREDLFFRLAAIVLELPPLRDRPEDIPLLADAFARDVSGQPLPLDPASLSLLASYRWPGNVRELRNAVQRAVKLGPSAAVPGLEAPPANPDFHVAREHALRAFERSYLIALLQRNKGSATAAAREANIARSYLYRMLEEHGIAPRDHR
jgi:DNA-binding NtrC family response regulator